MLVPRKTSYVGFFSCLWSWIIKKGGKGGVGEEKEKRRGGRARGERRGGREEKGEDGRTNTPLLHKQREWPARPQSYSLPLLLPHAFANVARQWQQRTVDDVPPTPHSPHSPQQQRQLLNLPSSNGCGCTPIMVSWLLQSLSICRYWSVQPLGR